MARTVGIGRQDFEKMRVKNNFYIDKTYFIKEWWEAEDDVTLIARPRRFGKTLNMSMLEKFFSVEYQGRGDLFEGLFIWEYEKYQQIQGTYPVVAISFAGIKENTFPEARKSICRTIEEQYNKNEYLLREGFLNEKEKEFYSEVSACMTDSTAGAALRSLSDFLYRYYGRQVIILLDEYDTPMQEAYMHGYWEELSGFIRSLFHSAFKSNPYLERAVMTGTTRVSKESIFSDLNNLEVITTTSNKYEKAFGFTEEEVIGALDEFGLSGKAEEVKRWYDGFTFGKCTDIYNPWSIINYLDKKEEGVYWANTSSNSLIEELLRRSSPDIKEIFECLLEGGSLTAEIDEQIIYHQLEQDEQAIWALLLASGYLKVSKYRTVTDVYGGWKKEYILELTNFEVKVMFRGMIQRWFRMARSDYNGFIKALLLGDIDAMNGYINNVSQSVFSYFDTGSQNFGKTPESFYHGFVLGLMVELQGRYVITSNRESGFGRYDVMLEPLEKNDDAMILEFKVFQPKKEKDLTDSVTAALKQIEEKNYKAVLIEKGIPEKRIRNYGFAFHGKEVLVGN